ncbi:Serine/threonine-rich protein adg2 [Neolecta irregularis DAH-3]|uniref:Serine/threonine-rich protein adg2 n=1 Tax=Neolecta irregularis (strain DAH-3) TaxID=1198029 RepID=A0A1U7LLR9_NEOID|nr:Serine/threonine-rich protein adg2 [Neolecta irregularis DAH-3]|eukprot:OLL23533.1 Serine/threonine-rich protein adg2 [Neolecta irregularis DAH-3]
MSKNYRSSALKSLTQLPNGSTECRMPILFQHNLFLIKLWNAPHLMRLFAICLFVSFTSEAIHILAPGTNTSLIKGESQTVSWSSVETDPTIFSLYLVNFVYWPPTLYQLRRDIPTSDGRAHFLIPCDVQPEYGWQLNAINGTNTYVIYAQSGKFWVTGNCKNADVSSKMDSCITVTNVCKIT